jgi:hypothetical protein
MQIVKSRLINKETIQHFLGKLTNENWEEVYKLEGVNEIFNLFLYTFIIIYENSFPFQNLTLNCKNNGWMTKGIQISCRRKKSLYIFSRNSNNYLIKVYYKRYCNILRKVIREARKKYYNHLISSSDNKIKTTWKIIGTESGKNITNEHLPHNFIAGNNKISSKVAAQTFCNYFTTLAENLNLRYAEPQSAMMYLKTFFPRGFPVMKISPVTENETSKIINSLKSKKSSGYDGVSNKMLKLCQKQLRKPLAHIINKSISTGIYPERLKYAVINPLHKKGDKLSIYNYRPISLVTGFAKIFEAVMYQKLYQHLEYYKILQPEQFGFQNGLSTEDAMYKLTNVILKAWNNKEHVIGIFCDITKAFDCVNHELLLMKLQYYGVQGKMLDWFRSYLQTRKQRVELKDIRDK